MSDDHSYPVSYDPVPEPSYPPEIEELYRQAIHARLLYDRSVYDRWRCHYEILRTEGDKGAENRKAFLALLDERSARRWEKYVELDRAYQAALLPYLLGKFDEKRASK
jgi:hypothetical protein